MSPRAPRPVDAARLRAIQRRGELVLGGTVLVFGLLCLSAAAVLWRRHERQVPVLGSSGPLAEALGWPWRDFPPVTAVEQETVRREFQLNEPLFARDLRPFWEVPAGGRLAPAGAAQRKDLAAGIEAMRPLLATAPGDPASQTDPRLEAGRYSMAMSLLTSAAAGNGRSGGAGGSAGWLALYDRGLLDLWKGNTRSAANDLRSAMTALTPALESPPVDAAERATELEAAIHTDYALGNALLAGGEPDGRTAARHAEAIHALREAVQLVKPLWETHYAAYAGVPGPLSFFPLHATGLPTAALTNDLVAAYLASPDYHDCESQPTELPCAVPRRRGPCAYRDKVFCVSLERASGSFGPPFSRLARRFYAGDRGAWGEEYRLWALSNAVDRTAENLGLGGEPRLPYNLGLLLIQAGELGPAADDLDQAVAGLDQQPNLPSSLPDEDFDRMTRLATVARVLAGSDPHTGSRGGAARERRPPSTARRAYRELYGDQPPLREFPPAGASFSADAEALIDRWLFLRLWRHLLAAGDLAGFEREYARFMAQREAAADFYRRWHDEVMGDLGERALARAAALEQGGERDKARQIRRLVAGGAGFPAEVAGKAGLGWWPAADRAGLAAGMLLLLLAPLAAALAARGLARAHRATFFSAYRIGRMGGRERAYPPAGPLPDAGLESARAVQDGTPLTRPEGS